MRCLLDKVTARHIMEGMLKLWLSAVSGQPSAIGNHRQE